MTVRLAAVAALGLLVALAPACGDSGGSSTSGGETSDSGDEPSDTGATGDETSATGDETSETDDTSDTGDDTSDTPEPGVGTSDTGETGDDTSETGDDTSETGDDTSETGDAEVPLRGACALAERWGGFSVEAHEQFSFVDGVVADGVNPITVLEEVLSEGECKLLQRLNPFCDPPCAAGETCGNDNNCVTFPSNQDAGVLVFEGLKEPLELEPVAPGNNYFATGLPHPAAEPDAEITLTATGGVFGDLALYGVGVHPLDLGEDVQWDVEEGVDLQVTWEPPPGEVRSHVFMLVNIDQHGASPLNLVCNVPDTGSASIPSSVMDELLAFGVSGFPNGQLIRRTVDSVPIGDGGCVEFVISSPRGPDVRVAGHTPCKSDLDCPTGQTCTLVIETCQ